MSRRQTPADCTELAGLRVALALDTHGANSLYLLINCGLVLELDLHRSTHGAVQRVTACCWTPTKRIMPRYCYDRKDERVVCSSCDEVQDFETEHYALFRQGRNAALTHALTAWFEQLGYICLEDTLAALTIQETCEQAFHVLSTASPRGHFHWVPSILSKTLGLPLR